MLSLFEAGDVRDVAEILRMVEPVADKEFVGCIEAEELGRVMQFGGDVLVEQRADLERAGLPLPEEYEEQLQRFAARVAVNRTVAGLHYPVDSAAGRLLGTALGQFFVTRCAGGEIVEWGFDGRKFHGQKGAPVDFDPRVSMTDGSSGYYEHHPNRHWPVTQAPLLGWVWKKALAEWK